MLFNSYVFILVFLPLALAGHAVLRRAGPAAGKAWLVAVSVLFYAWAGPAALPVLALSMLANHAVAGRLARAGRPRAWVAAGGGLNRALLGWFKYAGLFAGLGALLTGRPAAPRALLLPAAISYFTFQQIAYLVDIARRQAPRLGALDYALFVTFFPRLLAGPIVRCSEIMPQFADRPAAGAFAANLNAGLALFFLGLFKKAVLGDSMAEHANRVFAAAEQGVWLTALDAWLGTLAYAFQVYFDFSGYSDMAAGAARMFGIRLPINFNSPYQAASVADFWRRWHVSLSRFLRDYLYIPLGGNRRGPARQTLNALATMTLAGIWHGAGITFALWGFAHGVLLGINHAWRRRHPNPPGRALAWLYRLLTFVAILGTWVLFRAETLDGALAMFRAFAHGSLATAVFPDRDFRQVLRLVPLLLAVTWLLPNSLAWLREARPVPDPQLDQLGPCPRWLRWRPTVLWAGLCAGLMIWSIQKLSVVTEFLYFGF